MTYTEHTRIIAQDFEAVDATQSGGLRDHDDVVWVGFLGDGRWLSPDQATEVARAIDAVTAAHRARKAAQATA